jgi:hypothetical protein
MSVYKISERYKVRVNWALQKSTRRKISYLATHRKKKKNINNADNISTHLHDERYVINRIGFILIRYNDCLRAGRPRGRSSGPGRVKNFLFSMLLRPAQRPTRVPIQWVPGVKRLGPEADHSKPPIRLHGVVLY